MTKNDEECHADEIPRITLHRIAGSIMKGRKSARKKLKCANESNQGKNTNLGSHCQGELSAEQGEDD